jgi:hypothetical protein
MQGEHESFMQLRVKILLVRLVPSMGFWYVSLLGEVFRF